MQGKQLKKLEAELWRTADQLRANSKLTAAEYSMPVLGLIFLRHANNRFQKVKVEVEKNLPVCTDTNYCVSENSAAATQRQPRRRRTRAAARN